jgi:hypothetical protein
MPDSNASSNTAGIAISNSPLVVSLIQARDKFVNPAAAHAERHIMSSFEWYDKDRKLSY